MSVALYALRTAMSGPTLWRMPSWTAGGSAARFAYMARYWAFGIAGSTLTTLFTWRMPRPAAHAPPELREPEAVHPWSEEREDGGQEREAVENGDRDDERARVPHRREEGPLIEEHPGEADRDGEPGERDRAARRGHRARDRVVNGPAAGELFTEPVH